MSRLVIVLFTVLLLTSCTQDSLVSMQQNLAHVAQEKLKNTLAIIFTKELGKGVKTIIAALAQRGGYLDNPLVRILLPPPLGLAIDVARDMSANPKANLLVTLMNHAAEQAIPGAAPIIHAALAKTTPAQMRRLLDGDKTAVTDYLKAETKESLRETLAPVVAANLAVGGAQQVYSELLDAHQAQKADVLDIFGEAADNEKHDLAQYVTGKAVDGVFKKLGAQEVIIRENIDNQAGSMLQEIENGLSNTSQ